MPNWPTLPVHSGPNISQLFVPQNRGMMRRRGGNTSHCSVESERALTVSTEEVEDNDQQEVLKGSPAWQSRTGVSGVVHYATGCAREEANGQALVGDGPTEKRFFFDRGVMQRPRKDGAWLS